MTLREQIEALPVLGTATASLDKSGTLHIDTTDGQEAVRRSAVLDIIDQHEQELKRIRLLALDRDREQGRSAYWVGYASGIEAALDALEGDDGK